MSRAGAVWGALIVVLAATAAKAQGFNYELFNPITLAEAKADFVSDVTQPTQTVRDKVGNSYLDQGGRRWRASAAYTGRSRPLEADELEFIGNWLNSVSRPDAISKYRRSFLFTSEGKEYWLPVQGPVAAYFSKELKPGDTIELYLAEIGGAHRRDGWAWLPLVEEYRKP